MKKDTDHTYTLTLTVRNNPGVLVRCAQVFNRRGHNIEEIKSTAIDKDTTKMSILAYGQPETIKQITLQLRKLIDVMEVKQKETS